MSTLFRKTRSISLDDLERRYDGTIPPRLREPFRFGGWHQWQIRDAATRSALFDRLARTMTRKGAALRRRQATGDAEAERTWSRLDTDLRSVRTGGLYWRERWVELSRE